MDFTAPLLPIGQVVNGGSLSVPALSSNGQHLAFFSKENHQYLLKLANYYAPTCSEISTFPAAPEHLSFSPSNSTIFIVTSDRQTWAVQALNTLNTRVNPLALGLIPGQVGALAWISHDCVLLVGCTKKHLQSDQRWIAIADCSRQQIQIIDDSYFAPPVDGRISVQSFCAAPSRIVAFLEKIYDSQDTSPEVRNFSVYELNENLVPALISQFSFRVSGYPSEQVFADDSGEYFAYLSRTFDGSTLSLIHRNGKSSRSILVGRGEIFSWRDDLFLFDRLGCAIQVIELQHEQNQRWLPLPIKPSSATAALSNVIRVKDSYRFAVTADGGAHVFELNDPDVIALGADDLKIVEDAARRLEKRQLTRARSALEQLLKSKKLATSETAQRSTIRALAAIRRPDSLSLLIQCLGYRLARFDKNELCQAIKCFDEKDQRNAILECLRRPRTYRLGAVRILEELSISESIDKLMDALSDTDSEMRIAAAKALKRQSDMKALVPLLSRLNDENVSVRRWVQQAIITTLNVNGFAYSTSLKLDNRPLNLIGFTRDVISANRMTAFEKGNEPEVAAFLTDLIAAILSSAHSTERILNAIEQITVPRGRVPQRAMTAIGLAVALICADSMRSRRSFRESEAFLKHGVWLAEKADAPGLIWRCWHGIGECRLTVGDDQGAAESFRLAIDTIDRLWFGVLDKDRVRHFFRDKAALYDQAMMCYLRLGHEALALECLEKCKARFLGDLIARHYSESKSCSRRDVHEYWETLNVAQPGPIQLLQASGGYAERTQILAVGKLDHQSDDAPIVPEKLIEFYEAVKNSESDTKSAEFDPTITGTWSASEPSIDLSEAWWSDFVQGAWACSARAIEIKDEDESIYASLLDPFEQLYEVLAKVEAAVSGAELPIHDEIVGTLRDSYEEAAQLIYSADENLWLYMEHGFSWLETIAKGSDPDAGLKVIKSLIEALNIVLLKEPVYGMRYVELEEKKAVPPLRFAVPMTTRSELTEPSITVVDRAMRSVEEGYWRQVLELARGGTSGFREIINSLAADNMAQIEFAVSETCTVVFILFGGKADLGTSKQLFDKYGRDQLEVVKIPSINTATLRERLSNGESSWLGSYHARHKSPKHRLQWQEAMNECLEWLSSELWAPLEPRLSDRNIARIRIVPHRALHLVPFGAMRRRKRFWGSEYLSDAYELHYAPSASLYLCCQPQRKKVNDVPLSVSVVANPTDDLLFSGQEMAGLLATLAPSSKSMWTGSNARVDNLPTPITSKLFHYSGHGSYTWHEPLASSLKFADRNLTLGDLLDGTIQFKNSSLTVLSGCETSVTDPEDLADECLGLASGFIFATASDVISTLWSIDDLASSMLLTRFYDSYVVRGVPPYVALSQAQNWLRKIDRESAIKFVDDRIESLRKNQNLEADLESKLSAAKNRLKIGRRYPYAHPYYWAGFTATG
jgi:CHAT domain-containing protein